MRTGLCRFIIIWISLSAKNRRTTDYKVLRGQYVLLCNRRDLSLTDKMQLQNCLRSPQSTSIQSCTKHAKYTCLVPPHTLVHACDSSCSSEWCSSLRTDRLLLKARRSTGSERATELRWEPSQKSEYIAMENPGGPTDRWGEAMHFSPLRIWEANW